MDKLEKIIGFVYRKRKAGISPGVKEHPGAEALGAFVEGKLFGRQKRILQNHLTVCQVCAKSVALVIRAGNQEPLELPEGLLPRAEGLLDVDNSSVLNLILRLKDDIWEIIQANAAVLLDSELIPVPVLRSRKISNFKDELIVLKEFDAIRVEAKARYKGDKKFNLAIMVKSERAARKPLESFRVSLIEGDVELESQTSGVGTVIFEDLLIGKYRIEISCLDKVFGTINLEVKNDIGHL